MRRLRLRQDVVGPEGGGRHPVLRSRHLQYPGALPPERRHVLPRTVEGHRLPAFLDLVRRGCRPGAEAGGGHACHRGARDGPARHRIFHAAPEMRRPLDRRAQAGKRYRSRIYGRVVAQTGGARSGAARASGRGRAGQAGTHRHRACRTKGLPPGALSQSAAPRRIRAQSVVGHRAGETLRALSHRHDLPPGLFPDRRERPKADSVERAGAAAKLSGGHETPTVRPGARSA
jgi:hypothetical protein